MDVEFTFTAQTYHSMNEMLQCNADTDRVETARLSRRRMDIVHILQQSDDNQGQIPAHICLHDINTEEHYIPTIDLTNDAIIDYIENQVPNKQHTSSTSTSCKWANDTDSTLSSIINIDGRIIQDINNDQTEWEANSAPLHHHQALPEICR